MFWNKKKPKSKPQIKTTVPKAFKAKEPPPKWQPTFGETKKKDEKPPEVTTKSESKIDWENKFLKSFQKLTYRHRAWDVWRDYILLHACSISNVLDQENYDQREKRYLKIIRQYSKEEQAIFPKEQCTCGISELYDNVAKIMGVSDLSKVVYDCRKLSITKKVLDCLYKFYHSENQSDETITTCMLLYGPKADLDGDGYEVEVEDGFVTKGV